MLIEGFAGRFVSGMRGIVQATMTNLGSMRVAQTEGEGDEMTRAGARFFLSSQGATGIAPVQANPSTAAQWLIWNPPGNNVAAFVDVLGVTLASGTAGAGGSLHICIVGPKFAPTTIPTVSTANVFIKNANPLASRGSNLIAVSAQTLVNAAASDWMPLCAMDQIGTVLGQTQIVQRDIRGKLVIPPGCGLGLNVVSPTGTSPLWSPIGSWREYSTDLE
jgi:hypothetical protein